MMTERGTERRSQLSRLVALGLALMIPGALLVWYLIRTPAHGVMHGPIPGADRPIPPEPTTEELDAAQVEELLASQDQVEALRAERNAMPEEERLRINTSANAYTDKMARQELLQYRMEEVAWYRENTKDTGKVREVGEKFLIEYLKFASSMNDALEPEALREIAEPVIDDKTGDPIVRVYYARTLSLCREIGRARDILSEVDGPICEGTCPEIVKLFVISWPRMLLFHNEPDGTATLDQTVINAIVDYLKAESERENQRIVLSPVNALFDSSDLVGQHGLYDAILRNPDIDPWIRHMLVGQYYVAKGWDARGCGWASSVTPEGWKIFHENLDRGAAHLRCAWQLRPDYPEAAAELISVANAGRGGAWTCRDWFYEATRAQPDFYLAYAAMRNALLPRWGGSHQEMLDFADECVRTGRWDTYIPNETVNTLQAIRRDFSDQNAFLRAPGVVSRVKRHAEELLAAAQADPSIPGNAPGFWAILAATLVSAGEFQLARDIFDRHGDDLRQRNFIWADTKLETIRGRAYALAGPAKQQVLQLEEALSEDGPPDTSAEFFASLQTLIDEARKLDDSPQLQPYLDDLAAATDQLRRFYAGETVELPLDKDLTGWHVRGEVCQEPDESLRVRSYAGAHGAQLSLLTHFSLPYVVEAEIANCPDEYSRDINLGIMIGPSDRLAVNGLDTRRQALVYDSGKTLRTTIGSDPAGGRVHRIEHKQYHHFQIKLWPGRTQVFLDGKQYLDDTTETSEPSSRITFGQQRPAPAPNAFRCRNVRIRRLVEDPPAEIWVDPSAPPESAPTAASSNPDITI